LTKGAFRGRVMPMFGMKKEGASAKSKEVRGWVRELLALPDEAQVLVTELTCSEPGCPPVETVIAILRGPGQNVQVKIPLGLADLTRDDVAKVATSSLG
jgi:hypothetical protein